MTIEILVVYRDAGEIDIRQRLVDVLTKTLEDNYVDFDIDDVENLLRFRHARAGLASQDNEAESGQYMLLGIQLTAPEDRDPGEHQAIVDEFVGLLTETAPISHVVKFEDPFLCAELQVLGAEVFALEMKLRRVLTLIYLHAYQEGDPYDLICEEATQITAKEKPTASQMKAVAENQFFHLTFSQYVGLNTRPEINRVSALLDIIRDCPDYDSFRTEMNRSPIEHEDDALLLAGLRERMNAIEAMRNCVAHNRRPSARMSENYRNARPQLDRLLDDYLARWEIGGEFGRDVNPPLAGEGLPADQDS